MEINVVERVLKVNDELAEQVKAQLTAAGVVALNFISAPGSGKTTLLEETLKRMKDELHFGVIEGDPDTTLDAERIAKHDVPVTQINTSGGCHLEANLVQRALGQFDLAKTDLLLIENVGNLVCPCSFDLGEHARVAVVSVTEGHDKPAKYPKLFRIAQVVVLNKIDLMPHVDFDKAAFLDYVEKLNPGVTVLETSCRTGEGLDAWCAWLREQVASPATA